MIVRVISWTSDDFREANIDVEFGAELKNVGLFLVRQDLWQLHQNEIFVQNSLKQGSSSVSETVFSFY